MTSDMTMKALFLGLCVTLAAAAPAVHAGKVVREFSGSRSVQTAEFEVQAPWLIDWRVNSNYPREMGIAILLYSAADRTYVGRVVKTDAPGDGLRLMNTDGRFYFKIDAAMTNWTIRVEQLNEGEEELYTPKNPGGIQ
jgi:hypothetical protein